MKGDKVVIKFLRETKCYGAKHFLSDFPTNSRIAKWTKMINKEN